MEKQIPTIKEIKKKTGLDKIHPELHGREKLEKMIAPNKYYLVRGYVIPFKGGNDTEKELPTCPYRAGFRLQDYSRTMERI